MSWQALVDDAHTLCTDVLSEPASYVPPAGGAGQPFKPILVTEDVESDINLDLMSRRTDFDVAIGVQLSQLASFQQNGTVEFDSYEPGVVFVVVEIMAREPGWVNALLKRRSA